MCGHAYKWEVYNQLEYPLVFQQLTNVAAVFEHCPTTAGRCTSVLLLLRFSESVWVFFNPWDVHVSGILVQTSRG